MMKKLLLSSLIMLLSTIYVNAGEINSDIKEFVRLLSMEVRPTVSDYYRFYGEGSEEELRLELSVCEQKGWTPPLSDPSCTDYIKQRETNRKQMKSLYFEWLKTKLPVSPRLKIIKTDRIRGKNIVEHDLIYTTLDGINVIFFRTVGSKHNITQFGVLSVSKINGVSVQKLLDEDFKKQPVR